MDRRRKRAVAVGAAVAVAAAGGGVAYAAATRSDQRDALLNDAAQRLHVTPQQLRSALQGAFDDRLDQAVRDGKLTQQQADRIKQRVRDGGLPLGGPGGPGPGGRGMGFGLHARLDRGGPLGAGLDAAASYLGLTRAELGRDLTSGRSLADVARAQGKSVDGLEQALVDAASARLDAAVRDGKLTSGQRDAILRDLRAHVGDLVNGTGPGPRARHGWRPGPGGPGGPGGPPPWGAPGAPPRSP